MVRDQAQLRHISNNSRTEIREDTTLYFTTTFGGEAGVKLTRVKVSVG